MVRTAHDGPPGRILPERLTLVVSIALFAGATAVGQQTRPVTQSARPRILHFPTDRSLGTVYIRDASVRREIETFHHWIDGTHDRWETLGEAQGDVSIPAGQIVKLRVSVAGWKNPSPLARLTADDIDKLVIDGLGASREEGEAHGIFRTDSAGDAIMPHLAHLTGLKELNLSLTFVTGTGLRHIEKMKSLECLSLPRNVSDAGMNHVAKLTGLKRLYSKENNITSRGLASLAVLRELEELELGCNRMEDDGLVHLKQFPRLQYLMLWGKGFTPAAMVHVKEIRSLRIFYPGSPITDDEGLAQLATLPKLERLSLYHCEGITDAGLAHVAKMASLRQLDLGGARISDVGGEHLHRLTKLEWLDMPGTLSRPALVELLATKPHLRTLRGGTNATSGDEVLEQVGKMADMEHLLLHGQNLTDEGLAHLTTCRKLKGLTMMSCPITNKGLVHIGKITSLESLSLHRCKLTTSGLKQLNGLKKLEYLNVDDLTPDEGFMDISGLTELRNLTVGPAFRGEPLRDDDLACLAKLMKLEWFQMPYIRGISDKGLAHLAGLTRMERLGVGGEGTTDAGLSYLSGMKQLDMLTIKGDFTGKGLLQIERHPSLASLHLICPERPNQAIVKRLTQNLPYLRVFTYGSDLQSMRSIVGAQDRPAAGFRAGSPGRQR